MVMLYMLTLSMVSLPTSLARHLLVETAGNQIGDDYQIRRRLPTDPPPIYDYTAPHYDYNNAEGELFLIPWSLEFYPNIPSQSTVETFYDLILMPHQEI